MCIRDSNNNEQGNQGTGMDNSNADHADIINTNSALNGAQKKNSLKLILLLVIAALVGAIAYYFLFLSDKNDKNANIPNGNVPKVQDEKTELPKVDKESDADQDGLTDYLEKIIGTDSGRLDTDGDGYGDMDEIKNGYNPLTSEKYKVNEWDGMKEKIKAADTIIYEKMFSGIQTANPDSAFSSFQKLKEAYAKKDFEAYKNLMLKKDIEGMEQMMSGGWSYIFPESIEFIRQYKKNGNNIIVVNETDKDGNQIETEYVFVREDDIWKIDINETISLNMSKPSVIKSTTGDVDFQVLDIVVFSDSPKAGDDKITI